MEPPTTDAGPRPGPPPSPSAPPGGWPGPRQLRRRPEDGHLAGVCAGVAEYFNVDPVIVRIAAVVLLFSGPGAFAYILAWIFVPAADPAEVHANRGPIDRKDRGTQILGIVLLALALSVLWGESWSPARRWFFPLALIAIGCWLLLRHDKGADTEERTDEVAAEVDGTSLVHPPLVPAEAWSSSILVDAPLDVSQPAADLNDTLPDPPESVHVEPGAGDGGDLPPSPPDLPASPPPAPPPPVPPASRRRRQMLGPIVFGALLVWAGAAWLIGVSIQNGLAVGLCVLGLGFVLGAFVGGSRALILPALFVGAALAITAVVDIPLAGPIGEQRWAPASAAEVEDHYEVSVGKLVLDLSAIDLAEGRRLPIDVSVGVGHLVVLVPDHLALEVTTDVGAGEAQVLGTPQSGVGISTSQFDDTGAVGGTLELYLQVGLGQIEVERASSDGAPDPQLPR